MAEEHRRVVSRQIIAGTGMATEPDKIRVLEEEAEKKSRVWRKAPERGFGDVLKTAPARGELDDEAEELERRRSKQQQQQQQQRGGQQDKQGKPGAASAQAEAQMAAGALDAGAPSAAASPRSTSPSPAPAPIAAAPGWPPAAPAPVVAVAGASDPSPQTDKAPAAPRVPPDPRKAVLEKKLAAALAAPRAPRPADTPPTGSNRRKPT